jgi:hypothetical protein
MPTLIVLSDPMSGDRTSHVMHDGESLGAELMRLLPGGLTGAWRIFRETVAEADEIPAVAIPATRVQPGEVYLIVREMTGPALPFVIKVFVAIVLSYMSRAFMPGVRKPGSNTDDAISPNNALAGQTNQLRIGGRVPDILGRVRAYPDLLCATVETYNESQQTIGQMFVLGRGSYSVTDAKLGETPLTSIPTADLDVYVPGDTVPQFFAVKSSPEVGGVSLLGEDTQNVPPTPDVDFFGSTKTMQTLTPLAVSVGRPITVSGTFFNNAVFWIAGVPSLSQTTPPFTYTLIGPVVDELGSNPLVAIASEVANFVRSSWIGRAAQGFHNDEHIAQFQEVNDPTPWFKSGILLELKLTTGVTYRGRVTDVSVGHVGRTHSLYSFKMNDLNGVPQKFASAHGKMTYHAFNPTPATTDPTPPGGTLPNAPTNWYAVPMSNPDEIWLDIAFPQGLAWYHSGARRVLHAEVRAEFRRAGATVPQASVTWDFYYGTAIPIRFTKRVAISSLTSAGLPEGTATIEVRLIRVTEYAPDSTNNQYVQETRWERLAAVVQMPTRIYEDCTILVFQISNQRSATTLGTTALNCIATRILPTWTGSGWSVPAPTRKWADHFVARAKAKDGAYRTDAQLDLPAIYALQAELDSRDAGKQGEISLTLDLMQDIDSELSTIADVARAIVYRVGRKICVTRDQANPITLALFNGRTKSPAGETIGVRMTGDADNDCAIVSWVDEDSGWRHREFMYPTDALALNPLRVGTACANWPQAWRRAVFEWNRLKYRREQLTCSVTEDGRLCRAGDVVNITDDTATLSTQAGEVLSISGAQLTLDRNVEGVTGETFTILLRDVEGVNIDRVPCSVALGLTNVVTLERTPAVAIKPRDNTRGTLFAFYPDSAVNVRPWLVTGIEASGPYVQLSGVNYSTKVYAGDSAALPSRPPLEAELL